jgi:cardiolipin synthase
MYGSGYLHARTLSIDGEVCSIGSANLNIRSFSINYELNAVTYDAWLAQELEAAFERDLKDCYPFEPAPALRRRPAPAAWPHFRPRVPPHQTCDAPT